MSHSYFNGVWAEAQTELRHALVAEKKLGDGKDIPEGDRLNFFGEMASLYYKWISMYQKFDEAYDQIVHPQKLPLIRKLLDVVIARLIELRAVMVGTELSEVLYFDDILHFFSWMPSELDIPIPKYYVFHHPERLEREALLDSIIQSKKDAEQKAVDEQKDKLAHEKIVAAFRNKLKAYEEALERMQPHEAVLLIQTYERFRQGRERMAMAKYLAIEEAKRKRTKAKSLEIQKYTVDEAASIIQKVVRGFLARRRVARMRELEMRYLGLAWAPTVPGNQKYLPKTSIREMQAEIERNAAKRRRARWRYQKNFEEAESLIESRMRLLEAPEMAERMKWQLRTWALHMKEKEGKIPEIPKPALGGSTALFCPDRLPPEVLEKIAEAQGKKKKKPKVKKTKKKKNKKKKKKRTLVATKLEPMATLEDALKYNVEYNSEWRNRDESNNPEQKHEDEQIIQEKRRLVGQETRNKVDVLMKAELKVLKKALEKKKGGKGKKKKGKGKGKGKKAKGKGKKKGKRKKKGKKGKKKFKDLTPDRTWQSLFEELVNEHIIVKYPKVKLDDLVGEYSLVNETIRKYFAENMVPSFNQDSQFKMPFNANPPPTYGDIKRAVRDICILPLGSDTVHGLVDYKKSLLIAGPPGSGKKSLVHAICTEMNATLFDLTATNIAGKYPGKSGLTMLIHLVNKVGRLCQPSIILVDKVERMFAKKIPKTDKSDPKRLKKQMKKFLKIIGPEDQLMLIGLSSEPWMAKMKPLKKTFEKFLFIPKPDHGTRLQMWQQCLSDYFEDFHPQLNLPLLAKLSDGWTLGSIKECCRRAIKEHKRISAKEREDQDHPLELNMSRILEVTNTPNTPTTLGRKLIRMEDLTNQLGMIDPIFVEQEKAWNNWFNKTPIQKLRLASQRPTKGKKDKKGKKGKEKKRKSKKR